MPILMYGLIRNPKSSTGARVHYQGVLVDVVRRERPLSEGLETETRIKFEFGIETEIRNTGQTVI
jgi:hypothetical protein